MDIKDKIAQLRKVVTDNGATEAEMLSALSLADKLMKKHGITEDDLINVEYERDLKQGEFTQRQKAFHPSQKFCSVTIGEFCGVRIWSSYITPKKKHVKMFGFNGDVEMAKFLMQLIHDSMDRGWKEFLTQNGPDPSVSRHTQYWNYMMGFAERINERIEALMSEPEISTTGTDLISTKDSIIDDAMSSMLPNLRLKRTRGRGIRGDDHSMNQGKAAGDRVNLNRPIRTGPSSRKMIK